MQKKDFLYFIPFFIFFISHLFISELFLKKETIIMEDLTGKTLSEIIPWLKENKISIIISKIKNQINLKNELVLSQYPLKKSKISLKTPVYIEVNLLNYKENNLNLNNFIL